MIIVEFWMGGSRFVRHLVSQEAVRACYALPKTADRFEYWRAVTGDASIKGHVLVWSPIK
jgi:hypothetical protein